MILKCKRCKRSWEYRGKAEYYATCTNCLSKVKIKRGKENESNSVKEKSRLDEKSCELPGTYI